MLDSASESQFCSSVCQKKWLLKLLVLQRWHIGRALQPEKVRRWRSLCSSTCDFQYLISTGDFGPHKKNVWKQWLSVKISLQYASVASEIPLSIPSKSQSVAWHTVIIFFWELPLSNWSLFHLLMWAYSHINIWISSKSHNLTVRPPDGDLFLFWWF